MAKKQTRRSISINRHLFEQAKGIADAADTPLSQFTEDAIRAKIIGAPESVAAPSSRAPVPDDEIDGETDGEMLERCGDNAQEWARAFMAMIAKNPTIDEGTMIGWFANAIERSSDVRRWRREQENRDTLAAGMTDGGGEDPEVMSASEAVFGFAGWLTTRRTPITMSAAHDSGAAADAVKRFNDANRLPDPRPGWDKRLTHPANDPARDGLPIGGHIEIGGESIPVAPDEPRVVYDE